MLAPAAPREHHGSPACAAGPAPAAPHLCAGGPWLCAPLSRSHCCHVSVPFSSSVLFLVTRGPRALAFGLEVSFPFSFALPFRLLSAETGGEFLADRIPLKGEL